MNTQGNNYHNSTHLTGSKLKESQSKALTQDQAVLDTFQHFKSMGLTPERCLRFLRITEKLNDNRWHNVPIVSIRRAFSNLKRKGLIYKTDMKIKGDYGKEVSVWKLVK